MAHPSCIRPLVELPPLPPLRPTIHPFGIKSCRKDGGRIVPSPDYTTYGIASEDRSGPEAVLRLGWGCHHESLLLNEREAGGEASKEATDQQASTRAVTEYFAGRPTTLVHVQQWLAPSGVTRGHLLGSGDRGGPANNSQLVHVL
uniref:Uncharacterized protein n=1 Tax=Sphaerodactylus townsendi TaxID=933632 RepID=A0ACB8E6A3_9SAUR